MFASGVDLLFTPTTPTTAFPLGAIVRSVRDVSERHLHRDGEPRRHSGDVAADRPRRRAAGRRQFIAPHFDEATMFGAAYALERALGEEAHA